MFRVLGFWAWGLARVLGFRGCGLGFNKGIVMENQMEKNMEHDMSHSGT